MKKIILKYFIEATNSKIKILKCLGLVKYNVC